MVKWCRVKDNNEIVDAVFIGIFQRSSVIEPSIMRGGHSGGTESYPVAVVRIGDSLKEVKLTQVMLSFRMEDM